MWRDPGTPADSYYEVRPECAASVPESKFRIKAGKTLSARKWTAAFSPQGYLDISKVLGRIQRGGVHPSIRGEVWEFLLGSFDPQSTYEEREQTRESRRVKYEILKEVCKKMFCLIGSGKYITAPIISETGEPTNDPIVLEQIYGGSSPAKMQQPLYDGPMDKREIEWKLLLHQIGLDVARTDRTLMFYEKQENLSKLWDILSVYAWLDADVGYCQGMSDLCSPMIMLLDNEADAFWCFERLMKKLAKWNETRVFTWHYTRKFIEPFYVAVKRGNFKCTDKSVGVESQLCNLATVIQVIDLKLHQHLETLGGGDYLFAVRMLMVLFRREFSFADSLYLWEMMWALEYDPEMFATYEEEKPDGSKGKAKSRRQCGKFERENLRNGGAAAPLPISVFLVASVLKEKSAKLQTEARGLDDVVKILNDITGNIDAKKACAGAMKLHKKYLKKTCPDRRGRAWIFNLGGTDFPG